MEVVGREFDIVWVKVCVCEGSGPTSHWGTHIDTGVATLVLLDRVEVRGHHCPGMVWTGR